MSEVPLSRSLLHGRMGNLLSLGQTPAGHAELPVNLGHLIRSQIYLQSGLLIKYGIILSITNKYQEALHRYFSDKMPSI